MLDFNTSVTSKTQAVSVRRAVLACFDFGHGYLADELEEFKALACSSGVDIVSLVSGICKKPNAKYLIGKGKLEEISGEIQLHHAELVIFNHVLTPSQERNIERFLNCRVLDRTGLILDIFACRARTFEGRLQVELAQLQYLSTRLVRGWTHLERQRGGIGLRGPGETQLELDKRLIAKRIKAIKQQLSKVRSQREQGRRSRKRADLPVVSLVGYTNAGKSTLFNHLTGSDVYVADQLFATLDPTLRRLEIPSVGSVVLVDTVGFVRQLPHQLVDAFRATLEETQQADLLLHVVDVSSPYRAEFIRAVDVVLKEIGADKIPQIFVFNKIDLMEGQKPELQRNEWGDIDEVWISASKDEGIELVKQALSECLSDDMVTVDLKLMPEMAKLRAQLYEQCAIMEEEFGQDGVYCVKIHIKKKDYERLRKQYPEVLPR